jgi:hypothetical protein
MWRYKPIIGKRQSVTGNREESAIEQSTIAIEQSTIEIGHRRIGAVTDYRFRSPIVDSDYQFPIFDSSDYQLPITRLPIAKVYQPSRLAS